jgi:preprotein translocase subunit SecF
MLILKNFNYDFLGKRHIALALSGIMIVVSLGSILVKGMTFGIDFTGGTLVEVAYIKPAEIDPIREALVESGYDDAIVQYFGTARDIMIRIPVREDTKGAEISNQVMQTLRSQLGETLDQSASQARTQYCRTGTDSQSAPCTVQIRRVEFVGPQVGDELANQGGLAMLYALFGILLYVTWRFEWRFAVGSVVALIHDVVITVGFFSLFQLEFSLTVLAAILAVIGYSLNDTIVVFDRIRENFRKMRKGKPVDIMNQSINQTLPRTILTSATTLIVLMSLFLFGGDIIHNFSIALILGVLVGTYSSIFIASPSVLLLGVSRENLLPVKKEGENANADSMP